MRTVHNTQGSTAMTCGKYPNDWDDPLGSGAPQGDKGDPQGGCGLSEKPGPVVKSGAQWVGVGKEVGIRLGLKGGWVGGVVSWQ